MLRTLIVDDEIIVRIGLMSCVKWEDYGYEVVGACESGDEAAAALERLKPDIVFTDIKMPGMDGLELTAYIRQHRPQTKIVILSCLNEIDYVKRALKMGAEDYILKLSLTPETLGELLQNMRESILKAREADANEAGSIEKTAFEREQAYRMLLSGGAFPDERKKLLTELGYRQEQQSRYLVCCCLVDDFQTAYVRNRFSDAYLLKYVLLNALHEFLDKYPFAEAVSIADDEYLVVLRFPPETQIAKEIAAYVRRLNDALKTHLNLSISVGVAESFSDCGRLHEHYAKARELAALRFFYGRGSLITQEMFTQTGSKLANKDLPKILQAAVDGQDQEAAKHMIAKWFEDIAANRCFLLPKTVKIAVIEAWIYVSGYHFSDPERRLEEMANEDDYFSSFWNAETLEILEKNLQEAIGMLMGIIAENQNGHPSIIRFKRYLNEHIADNISLSEAASICCFSKTYFCTLFKKETGENFVDYFSRLKIEKARQLLLTENIKVYEAGNAVGITDVSYFNKLFRKYYHISPSQVKPTTKQKYRTTKS